MNDEIKALLQAAEKDFEAITQLTGATPLLSIEFSYCKFRGHSWQVWLHENHRTDAARAIQFTQHEFSAPEHALRAALSQARLSAARAMNPTFEEPNHAD